MDIASGQAKIVGNDPWMVPSRTLDPVWSPDSKWVAYASRLKSLYHAIFVSNVETGESKQVTDGLADSVWPAWDASGKYLWFPCHRQVLKYDFHGEMKTWCWWRNCFLLNR